MALGFLMEFDSILLAKQNMEYCHPYLQQNQKNLNRFGIAINYNKIIKPKIDQVKNTLEYSLEKKEYKSNMQLDKKEDPKIIIQD